MRLILNGPDGSNPLGFMVAIGTLVACRQQGLEVTLAWENAGRWRPVLYGVDSVEEVLECLQRDAETWADEPALTLLDGSDIKPSVEEARSFLLASRAHGGRTAAIAAAFFTDGGRDRSDNIKPTSWHFTAGNQRFLDFARHYVEQPPSTEDLAVALMGPWRHSSKSKVFGWDSADERDYALRAISPADDKKLGVPGADWLAFRGLEAFSTVPVSRADFNRRTPGFVGGWYGETFTWALWTFPLTPEAVSTVLTTPKLPETSTVDREARGIAAVFRCRVLRTDQGGYGSFAPSAPA